MLRLKSHPSLRGALATKQSTAPLGERFRRAAPDRAARMKQLPARMALALVVAAAPALARAADPTPVPVRFGNHQGYGRLVFDFPRAEQAQVTRIGDQVTLRFRPETGFAVPAHPPRNVLSLQPGSGGLTMQVAADAQLRRIWIGHRLVLDVQDPAGPPARPPSPPPSPRPPPPAPHALVPPPILPPPAPRQVAAAPAVPTPSPTPPPPVSSPAPAAAAPPSAPIALQVAASLAGKPGAAFSVPFDPDTGAAAFRRGADGYVVFGQSKPIDLTPLRDDKVLASAQASVLADATVIRLRIDPGSSLSLTRAGGGWIVAVTGREPSGQPIAPVSVGGALTLPDDGAARVVTITDPVTGSLLLVGTQRAPGPAVAVRRRMPAFTLAATWQGVVVEPLSDRLAMIATKSGFTLTSPDPHDVAMPADDGALVSAAALTRRFGIAAAPTPVLVRKLDQRIREAARAPSLARGIARREVGRAMIALGMGAEAQAVLLLASDADPRLVHDPDTIGLAAIAALLAGRAGESAGIDDPALGDSDEVAFWRAVRAAALHRHAPEAPPAFAATFPLALSYPAPLRAHVLPMVAEALAGQGETKAAHALLDGLRGDPALALARAMLLQSDGQTDAALARYDRLAAGPDRKLRVRAAARATELRLDAGRIAPAAAADQLDRLVFAWRGDDRDLRLRLRVAALRQQAGQWQAALETLRDAATSFPDSPEPRARLRRTFAAMLHGPGADSLGPLAFVTIAERNTDLLPDGPDGDALADALADRLDKLDLPGRAAPILQRLMQAAPPGPRRAQFGERLARARLAMDDAGGALAALAASGPDPADPPSLDEQRAEILAGARAKLGDMPGAVAALVAFPTESADALRATLLEQAHDWPAAQAALADALRATAPTAGALSARQRDVLVRLAAARVQAGDAQGLARLRADYGPRMTEGTDGSMFRLLTEPPVTEIGDLPRAARETSSAGTLASR